MISQLPITVALADDSESSSHGFQDVISGDAGLELVGVASTGDEAVSLVHDLQPDVLVLDIVLSSGEGLSVLENLKQHPPIRRPSIITVTGWDSDCMIPRLMELGVDYYMIKPVDLDVLIKRIKDFSDGDPGCSKRRLRAEQLAKAKIDDFGVPANYKGYKYLTDAVCWVVEQPGLINNLSAKLYPLVAKRHGCSAASVERSMRHAVEHAVVKGNQEFLESEFGNTMDADKGKPTNSTVIAKFSDEIRLQLKMEGD